MKKQTKIVTYRQYKTTSQCRPPLHRRVSFASFNHLETCKSLVIENSRRSTIIKDDEVSVTRTPYPQGACLAKDTTRARITARGETET